MLQVRLTPTGTVRRTVIRPYLTNADKDGRSTSEGLSKLKEWTSEVKAAAGSHSLFVTEYGSVRRGRYQSDPIQRSTSTSEVAEFISKATALLQSTSSVDAIFPFPHLKTAPFVSGSSLTRLATAFLNA